MKRNIVLLYKVFFFFKKKKGIVAVNFIFKRVVHLFSMTYIMHGLQSERLCQIQQTFQHRKKKRTICTKEVFLDCQDIILPFSLFH